MSALFAAHDRATLGAPPIQVSLDHGADAGRDRRRYAPPMRPSGQYVATARPMIWLRGTGPQ